MKDELIKEFFTERLKKKGSVTFETFGSSMKPFIRPGDYVTLRPVNMNEIKIGDILVYRKEPYLDIIIAHRLVKREASFLITKGDSHIRADSPILPQELLGKAIAIKRNGKTIYLEKNFYIWLGGSIARLSLNCPWILFIIRKFIDNLRVPHLIPFRLFQKFKSHSCHL